MALTREQFQARHINPSAARKLKWATHAYFGYRETCIICGVTGAAETMLSQAARTYAASRGYAHAACIGVCPTCGAVLPAGAGCLDCAIEGK